MRSIPARLTPEQREQLRKIIREELARRGWKLADEPSLFEEGETFEDRVAARVEEWMAERQLPLSDNTMNRAVVHEYCRLLHAAFQRDSSLVQSIAFEEIDRHAKRALTIRWGASPLIESAVLYAFSQMWRNMDRFKPGYLLAYFVQIAMRELWRQAKGENARDETEITDTAMFPQGDDEDGDPPEQIDPSAQAEFDALLRDQSHESFFACLSKCLKNARQTYLIRALFFEEMKPMEIADKLGVSTGYVYTDKCRALKRIREHCPKVIRELCLLISDSGRAVAC